MRAVRANGEGGVAVVHLDPVEPDYATDPVHVRVRSCGICGSDLHFVERNFPVILGHEFAGVLDDGMHVAVQPGLWCNECDRCRAGQPQLCRTWLTRFHGMSVDGGLADEVIVDRRCLVPLAPEVTADIGALVEPLAVALHAIRQAHVPEGARVLVIGGGPIGLAVVAAARDTGASVDLLARYPHQIAAGERLGATTELVDEYDIVIDAAGSQSSIDTAVRKVRPGGTIVVAATYWERVGIGRGLLGKEATVVPAAAYGMHNGRRDFDDAAALLARQPELADTLVTHRFPLDDAAEAFRVAADRASGAIKVVLVP